MNISFIPLPEIKRIQKAIKNSLLKCQILSDIFRINTLYMIMKAGSGHIGTSFSSIDIVTWLWVNVLKYSDIYFSSKGHDVPALYSALIGLGKLDFEFIHKLRRLNGLPGHPDIHTPYIVTNTGSLGMGISKAKGMALANRLFGKKGQIFVLTGDGELQEGQFWESLQPSANAQLSEITVLVDHNKIQSDSWVSKTSDLGNLEAKFKAFGWEVARCNGHDFKALKKVFDHFRKIKNRPQILIADTVKGKGVSFMEQFGKEDALYKFHSGAPSFEHYQTGLNEIVARVNLKLTKAKLPHLNLNNVELPPRSLPQNPQRLVTAYGDELVKLAKKHKDIIALDADLVLDTGLISFRQTFPKRFIECGIAEQDMVSTAGGLALRGKLPIVHSFASFLTTRPNEQIYNNATEQTKIIYTGSLAGLLPGGPGHSHQSVRDISALGDIPGLTLIQPANEKETKMALRWAVEENPQSTYIRLVSIPLEILYQLPKNYHLKSGQGIKIVDGKDTVLIAYGPTMLTQAYGASELLKGQGISLAVINLPWLNKIDPKWLYQNLKDYRTIFTLDDHYLSFGQGTLIASTIAKTFPKKLKVASFGLVQIPACGQNDEVLKYHGLDAESLAEKISVYLKRWPN